MELVLCHFVEAMVWVSAIVVGFFTPNMLENGAKISTKFLLVINFVVLAKQSKHLSGSYL